MTFLRIVSATFLALICLLTLIAGGVSPASYNLVQDEGTPLARRSTLNCVGAGIVCSDDNTNKVTLLTVAGVVNYSQTFTSQTSVALAHSLGTTAVIVECYDGSGILIVPNSTTLTNTSTVTVTFAVAQTGKCIVNGAGTPSPAYTTVQSASSAVAQQPIVNFVNGTCVNNAGATRTDCTFYNGVTTQTDVTGSRTLGTVFQNATSKPIWVNVIVNSTSNNLDAQTDSSNPPTSFVASTAPVGGGNVTITFIVLPGNFYLVSSSGATLAIWVEWT